MMNVTPQPSVPLNRAALTAPLSVAEGVAAELVAVAVEESLPLAFFWGPL